MNSIGIIKIINKATIERRKYFGLLRNNKIIATVFIEKTEIAQNGK